MKNANIYEVQMPRGIVYAIHDLTSGTIWTEHTHHGATQLAREHGLSVVEEKTITHAELLRLLGHEPPPKPVAPPASTAVVPVAKPVETAPAVPVANEFQSPGVVRQIPFPVRYHLEDEADAPPQPMADAIVIPRTSLPPLKSVFCSEKPIFPGGALAGGEKNAGKADRLAVPFSNE